MTIIYIFPRYFPWTYSLDIFLGHLLQGEEASVESVTPCNVLIHPMFTSLNESAILM